MWTKSFNDGKQQWQIVDDGIVQGFYESEADVDIAMESYNKCPHIEWDVEIGMDNDYHTLSLTCNSCFRTAEVMIDTSGLEWI